MTTFESSHYLLCDLGDGALFYFGLNIETGKKKHLSDASFRNREWNSILNLAMWLWALTRLSVLFSSFSCCTFLQVCWVTVKRWLWALSPQCWGHSVLFLPPTSLPALIGPLSSIAATTSWSSPMSTSKRWTICVPSTQMAILTGEPVFLSRNHWLRALSCFSHPPWPLHCSLCFLSVKVSKWLWWKIWDGDFY